MRRRKQMPVRSKRKPLGLKREDVVRLMPLRKAAELMRGRDGKPPSIQSVRDWTNPKRGYRAGRRVLVLWSTRINGEILTLPERVEEFEQARALSGVRAC